MTEEQPVATFNPNKINEVDPERLQFPMRYSREAFDAPESAVVSEFERTADGYMEIEWQYKEVQRALALDFDHHAATDLDRPTLEQRVEPRISKINEARSKLETPAEPVDPTKFGERLLRHMARPIWQEHIPVDTSEQSEKAWEGFKADYPEHMQINLDELRLLDGKMRILSADEGLRTEVQELHRDKIEVMRAAAAFMGADRKIENIAQRVADIYVAAGASNRSLTPAETRHIERLEVQQDAISAGRGREIKTPELKAQVGAEIRRRVDIGRRRDFERGLVMTGQMKEIIEELLPSLAQGKPALLLGETGGAKTALAEYISRQYFGKEPELISGYGDVNSYQVMGKPDLKNDEGTPVSEFTPGPMIRAMESGRPIILDEVNAMPPEFLKRLNKIAQLRPGDVFTVQEDSGREVTIKRGFCIIATANEKSKRYKGVEDLSVEFQNRFGANVVRVHYPDHNVVYGQPPFENAIIAKAAMTDRSGSLVGGISTDELERFVRACHVSQQVFSGNHGAGFSDFNSSERIAENKPGLDEAVLAPRTMVALLEKVRDSHGKIGLEKVLQRFVTGIKGDNDEKQMATILQGYGFLKSDD